ncbi:MAG TPA: RodZ domain-containing protein [Paraburkholderia sp.]|jgi:cytoskeleton protein RodZ
MSEPQHPQPHDTERHAGRPAPVAAPAPAALPPAVQAGFESLASVGARLAQLRESKGWSIEDVSSRLKVSVAKIRALEAGDLSRLPDTTFALGVVRSYAKMLGADPAPYTQALRREKGVPEPDLSMPASSGTDLPRGRMSLSLGSSSPRSRSWLWGVAAVVVALIALAMWHTNGGESSAWLARLKATASSATGVAGGAGSASTTVAQGQTTVQPAVADEGANEASDAQTAAADATASQAPQTQMPAPLPMAAAPASGVPVTAVQPSAVPAPAPAVASTVAATPASANAAQAAPAGSSTVAVKVTQDSWFSVRQKDGKEVFSGLVHAGDSKEISGEAPFKITVGNRAGLDSVTLDGQPVDPAKYAATKGNVARFALP